MGANYEFQCENCSLHAEVSGGPDSGMYAAWTTVWCPDCESLSDTTTSSEDSEAVAEYQKHAVTLPDEIICPNCNTPGLRSYQQSICPKCGKEKTVLEEGRSFSNALLVCETCATSVKRIDTDHRFFVYPDDKVSIRLYCDTCDTYPLLRVHCPGAYISPPEWKEHELKCEKCDSKNVRTWSAGQPCPACGGNVRQSADIVAFTD